ncbi:MAG: glycoside hydrolase family 36 N-terminal domain-containing protein [Eubacterium ramulus]
MAITFDANRKIFTNSYKTNNLSDAEADAKGYLLHLYYGARAKGTYGLPVYAMHGPRFLRESVCGKEWTVAYSLDALPQEYPSLGTGDCRGVCVEYREQQIEQSAVIRRLISL